MLGFDNLKFFDGATHKNGEDISSCTSCHTYFMRNPAAAAKQVNIMRYFTDDLIPRIT